jgi:hypothetical protein
MSTGKQTHRPVDSKEISTVTSYKFLGDLITSDGYNRQKIKRRISLSKATMSKLTQNMNDLVVSTNTEVKLVQTVVLPAVLYGCESWTLRKADKREIRAFELWRLRRIPWSARMMNE